MNLIEPTAEAAPQQQPQVTPENIGTQTQALSEQFHKAQRLLDERRNARAAANVELTPSEKLKDVVQAPARGIANAYQSISNVVTAPVRWALGKAGVPGMGDWEERILGRSKTTAGGMVEAVTQFLAGSVFTGGAAGLAAKTLGAAASLPNAARLTKQAAAAASGLTEQSVGAAAVRGAITDFSAFGAHEERLSNLIQEYPSLANPLTQYLQASDDDTLVEGRIKNVIEGQIAGAAGEVVFKTLRALKKGYSHIRAGGNASEVEKLIATELEHPEVQAKTQQALSEQKLAVERPADAAGDVVAQNTLEQPMSVKPLTKEDVTQMAAAKKELKSLEAGDKKITQTFLESFDAEGKLPSSLNFRTFGNSDKDFQNLMKAAGRTADEHFKTKNFGTLKTEGHAQARAIIEGMSDNPEEAAELIQAMTHAGEQHVRDVIAAGDVINSATFGLQNHIDEWLNPGPLKNFPTWNRTEIDSVVGRYMRAVGEAKKVKSYSGMALQANKAPKRRYLTNAEKKHVADLKEQAKQRALNRQRERLLENKDIAHMTPEEEALVAGAKNEAPELDAMYEAEIRDIERAAQEQLAGEEKAIADANLQAEAKMEAEIAHKMGTITKLSDEDLQTFLSEVARRNDPIEAAKFIQDATNKFEPTTWRKCFNVYMKYDRASMLGHVASRAADLASGLLHNYVLSAQRMLGGQVREGWDQIVGATYSLLESSRIAASAFKNGPILTKTAFSDQWAKASVLPRSKFRKGLMGDLAYYANNTLNAIYPVITAADELVKQSSARGKLYADFMAQGRGAGLAGAELDSFVRTQMKTAINNEGSLWSFDRVMAEGFQEASFNGITDRTERFKFATRWAESKAVNEMTAETMDIIGNAKQYAEQVTFQTPFEYGSLGYKASKFLEQAYMLQPVFAFFKTPVLCIKEGIRNTPIMGQAMDYFTGAFTHADPAVRATARGRLMQSTMMLPTIGALAANGLITGYGPSDPKQRSILKQTGWKPYSFKIGDSYFSYQRFDPLSTPFGIIADVVERWNSGTDESDLHRITSSVIVAFAWNLGSKSCLRGVNELTNVLVHPTDWNVDSFARSLASPLVPTIFKDIKIVLQESSQDPMKEVRTLMDAWIDKLPYGEEIFGHKLDRSFNVIGEPKSINAGTKLERVASPVQRRTLLHDPVIDELSAIGSSFGRIRPLIGGTTGVDTRRINMGNQTAYGRLQELVGTVRIKNLTLRQTLERMMRSKEYQNASSEKIVGDNTKFISQREEMIRTQIRKFHNAAREQLQRELPEVGQKVRASRELKRNYKQRKTNAESVRSFIKQMQ